MINKMEKIIKGQPIKIEFGEYDNFHTMIPLEILDYKPDNYYKVFIRWQRPNTDCTIDLLEQEDKIVDFESFGYNIS